MGEACEGGVESWWRVGVVGAEGGLDGLGSPVGLWHGDFEGEKLWILMDGGFLCFVVGREM